jgi:hypothetical protein
MYQVEFAADVITDLTHFTEDEQDDILIVAMRLGEEPRPPGVIIEPLIESADGRIYVVDLDFCRLFYAIYETAQVVRVMALIRRFSLN